MTGNHYKTTTDTQNVEHSEILYYQLVRMIGLEPILPYQISNPVSILLTS
jgi:hypothetical protein